MKDQFGNNIPGAEYHNPHGQKVDHKGNILEAVKGGIAKAVEAVKHVAEKPFKHEEPAKAEESPKAPEETK